MPPILIPPVRAAGGVVWRGEPGAIEVLVVHRPKYDDWTIPKGKADNDAESSESCAIREVHEETGLLCRLGPELISIRYLDRLGRPKVVRYWAMTPVQGEAGPDNEIDEVRWLSVDAAAGLLSYDRDREVLASFTAILCERGD